MNILVVVQTWFKYIRYPSLLHLYALLVHNYCLFTFLRFITLLFNTQLQTAKSQSLLIVELHEFNNKHNLKTSNEEICCCDNDFCGTNRENFAYRCDNFCDIWFSISLSRCILPLTCSVSTPTQSQTSLNSVLNVNYKVAFLLDPTFDMVSMNVYINKG